MVNVSLVLRTVVFFRLTAEKDNLLAVGHPDVLIGCDCFPFTDPKTGHMVADWDTPWDAVNTHPRTSGAHGKLLRLVRDNSALEPCKNALPTTGIPYVVVNGTVVVKDSKVLKGVYPGKPIRAPIQN